MSPSRDSMDGGHALVGRSEAVTLHWPVVHCDCHCPPEHDHSAPPVTREDPVSRTDIIAQAIHQHEDPHLEGVSLRQIGLAHAIERALAASPADGTGVDVRPELVQWFHDGEEQCDHAYDPPSCALSADAMLESFTVEPRIYDHEDGTFGFQREHFARLHRAALEGASDGKEQR